jgi:hypothetical protein
MLNRRTIARRDFLKGSASLTVEAWMCTVWWERPIAAIKSKARTPGSIPARVSADTDRHRSL